MIINTGKDAVVTELAIKTLLEHRVEGIIYAAMYHKAVRLPDSIREVPAVLLNCYSADRSLPSVVPDEVRGGREATEALCVRDTADRADQRRSYQSRRRLGVSGAISRPLPPMVCRLTRAGPPTAIRWPTRLPLYAALMRLPEPPTALFCATDRTAMGAYDALQRTWRSIPGDVAIRGFDNQDVIAPYSPTALYIGAPALRDGAVVCRVPDRGKAPRC